MNGLSRREEARRWDDGGSVSMVYGQLLSVIGMYFNT